MELSKMFTEYHIDNRQFYFSLYGKMERNLTDYISREQSKVNHKSIKFPCTICLDQNTHTGYAIFDKENRLVSGGILVASIKTSTQKYIQALTKFLEYLIDVYQIDTVLYEEIFLGKSVSVFEKLVEIRSAIKKLELYTPTNVEIASDREFNILGIDNKVWKEALANPNKFKKLKTENEKVEINRHISYMYPILIADAPNEYYIQDMFDAIGMGIGMLIKNTYSGRLYQKARYDKFLPITQKSMLLTEEEFPCLTDTEQVEKFVGNLPKDFRLGYEVGGISLVSSDSHDNKNMQEVARRYLTHKDNIHVIKLDESYKMFYNTLLEHDISLVEYKNSPTIPQLYVLSVRKKRK